MKVFENCIHKIEIKVSKVYSYSLCNRINPRQAFMTTHFWFHSLQHYAVEKMRTIMHNAETAHGANAEDRKDITVQNWGLLEENKLI